GFEQIEHQRGGRALEDALNEVPEHTLARGALADSRLIDVASVVLLSLEVALTCHDVEDGHDRGVSQVPKALEAIADLTAGLRPGPPQDLEDLQFQFCRVSRCRPGHTTSWDGKEATNLLDSLTVLRLHVKTFF